MVAENSNVPTSMHASQDAQITATFNCVTLCRQQWYLINTIINLHLVELKQ